MSSEVSYSSMIQPRGKPYSRDRVHHDSHYYDPIDQAAGRAAGNSHIWGDASAQTQIRAIDALIASGERAGLQPREIAYVLAIARAESGFNPDAAAGTTSAFGLGQFIDKTGGGYGINDGNRNNLRMQADALVAHYQDNAALAHKRGQGEEYIYKYHHDGPAREDGGLELSAKKVMPHLDEYEKFVREHQQKLGTEPLGPSTAHRSNPAAHHARPVHHDTALRPGAHGAAVTELQTQLQSLGYAVSAADGHFGSNTRSALQAFQRDHGLHPGDGIAGPNTLTSLHKAVEQQKHAPTLADPGHPGHGAFIDVRQRLHDFNAQCHVAMDQRHLDQLAAALTVNMHDNPRFKHVDDIAVSRDGQKLFLIQRYPIPEEVQVNVAQGMNTSLAHSAQDWDRSSERQEHQHQQYLKTAQQEQGYGGYSR
ncbi:MAG: peptidoglycan-binding protein [Desulfovibrionaceae bacterium]|nr:peptidoglycan-binding protein [Desulfovibrionaceae bacterium]